MLITHNNTTTHENSKKWWRKDEEKKKIAAQGHLKLFHNTNSIEKKIFKKTNDIELLNRTNRKQITIEKIMNYKTVDIKYVDCDFYTQLSWFFTINPSFFFTIYNTIWEWKEFLTEKNLT